MVVVGIWTRLVHEWFGPKLMSYLLLASANFFAGRHECVSDLTGHLWNSVTTCAQTIHVMSHSCASERKLDLYIHSWVTYFCGHTSICTLMFGPILRARGREGERYRVGEQKGGVLGGVRHILSAYRMHIGRTSILALEWSANVVKIKEQLVATRTFFSLER